MDVPSVCGVGAHEPGQQPAQHHRAPGDPHQAPEGVLAGVGRAPADLDQQIAVGLVGLEPVVGEVGHGHELGRLAIGQPVAVVEQRGADRHRDGEPVRSRPGPEDQVVLRGQQRVVAGRDLALGQHPGGLGERLQGLGQGVAIGCHQVEGGDDGVARLAGDDAGLVRAVEVDRGERRGQRGRGRAGRGAVARRVLGAAGADDAPAPTAAPAATLPRPRNARRDRPPAATIS